MLFRARWRILLPLLALATACGDGSEEGGSPLTAGDSLDGSSGNDEASTGDSGPALDMPADEGLPTATDEGQNADECTNVDILFVIDNSASMADQQDSLIASFGGFVAGIEANLAFAESVHVGVVSSDNYYANGDGCTDLGDLVTQTGGLESSMCVGTPFTSGKRYMDETEIDLTAKFKCVAELGIGGSDDEKVAGAVLGALAPANNDPGACNDGFSRLDSLLVIVIVTDEDDAPEPYMCDPNDPFGPNPCDTTGSGGTPQEWYEAVVAYKANIPENVVVLSLLGQSLDNDCGAVVASKLIGFTNRFGDNGFTGDVCAGSYDEFFTAALPVVDTACENYVPVP
ncbi:MAG: hypothetical protein KC431_21105 [Myxococcales bacterium]|nr:hypothetical protein [Myxococcales bacterium]